MLTVPLPFFVAFVLLLLLGRIARLDDDGRASRPFMALIAVSALHSVLIGLRWGYDLKAALLVMPVLAAALPPLALVSFQGLTHERAGSGRAPAWPHAVAPAAIALLVVFWRDAIDFALFGVYAGYVVALMRLARLGPDALTGARFESVVPAHRALQIGIAVLVALTLVDALVALDFELTGGEHAESVVGLANIVGLLAVGVAAAMAGKTRPPARLSEPAAETPRDEESASAAGSTGDVELVSKLDELVRTQGLYRDDSLNLNRLARAMGTPARQISAAINRVHSKNVSQYVNGFRIAEACRLLAQSDRQVSRIMFDVGFQTKSNFNREFRRVTGMSPVEWRVKSSVSPLSGSEPV